MPLADLVVDTNVLVHSQNPRETRFADAVRLLQLVLACDAVLCLDEGFDTEPSRNRSMIAGEYLQNLQFGSVALAFVTQMAQTLRIKQLPRRPSLAQSRRINQLLRNRTDRTFLSVAINSTHRVLVSHDFVDFQPAKRRTIRRELEVAVIEASECCALCETG